MSVIWLIVAVVATVICFEATRRGAFGAYPWGGYLIIFVIWALILLGMSGAGSGLNLRIN